jgi:phosphate transport system protein
MDRFFHSELETVRADLIRMGSRATGNVQLALRTLVENDSSLVADVMNSEDAIDQLNKAIDAEAIRYFTLRSPVARDVRLLIVAIKSSRELERIGDEAVSVAKRARIINNLGSMPHFYHVVETAGLAVSLLSDALQALTGENPAKARNLPLRDKEIDRLHKLTLREITQSIIQHPQQTEASIELIFISKALERIGDHASNIAEDVVFLFDGKDIRHSAATRHPSD